MHGFSKKSTVCILLTISALMISTPALASTLVGTWSNAEGSFSFGADSSVEVRTQGQVYTGVWSADGSMLMLQLTTGTMLFQAGLDGDTLMLADANGTYVFQRVSEGQGYGFL